MFVIESGKTRTKAALEALNMVRSTGAHIVGATLTKSAEDMGGYGYKSYGYGALDRKSSEIIMIPHEADAWSPRAVDNEQDALCRGRIGCPVGCLAGRSKRLGAGLCSG